MDLPTPVGPSEMQMTQGIGGRKRQADAPGRETRSPDDPPRSSDGLGGGTSRLPIMLTGNSLTDPTGQAEIGGQLTDVEPQRQSPEPAVADDDGSTRHERTQKRTPGASAATDRPEHLSNQLTFTAARRPAPLRDPPASPVRLAWSAGHCAARRLVAVNTERSRSNARPMTHAPNHGRLGTVAAASGRPSTHCTQSPPRA